MRYIRSALCGALLSCITYLPAQARQGGGEGAHHHHTTPPPTSPATRHVSDTLRLADLYAAARARNPGLRAAGATVAATRAREGAAGVPPDPMLELGAMNLSLPGLRADMASSMAPSILAMQTIPFPGKLALGSRIAAQETAVAEAEADERWWQLRAELARAFYDLYQTDRALALAAENLALLRDLETVARSLYAAGTGRQADLLRASVEVARARAELARLEAARRSAAARLHALVGTPVVDDVAAPALPALPADLPPLDTLADWAEQSRPLLAGLRLRVEQATTRRSLARRELWPDLTLGVQYGQGRYHGGTERMGSVMLGFSVPVFAGRRQLKAREEAAAHEDAARAELDGERAVLAARLHELAATLDQLRQLIALYQGEVLPLAEANAASALAAYRAGTVDLLTVIEARTGYNTYRRELYALIAEYGATIAALESTIGRELDATGQIFAEVE